MLQCSWLTLSRPIVFFVLNVALCFLDSLCRRIDRSSKSIRNVQYSSDRSHSRTLATLHIVVRHHHLTMMTVAAAALGLNYFSFSEANALYWPWESATTQTFHLLQLAFIPPTLEHCKAGCFRFRFIYYFLFVFCLIFNFSIAWVVFSLVLV